MLTQNSSSMSSTPWKREPLLTQASREGGAMLSDVTAVAVIACGRPSCRVEITETVAANRRIARRNAASIGSWSAMAFHLLFAYANKIAETLVEDQEKCR